MGAIIRLVRFLSAIETSLLVTPILEPAAADDFLFLKSTSNCRSERGDNAILEGERSASTTFPMDGSECHRRTATPASSAAARITAMRMGN